MHRRRPWLATRVTVRTTCAPRRPAPSPPRSTGGNGHARRRSMVSLGRGCKPAWTGPTVDCGEDLVAAKPLVRHIRDGGEGEQRRQPEPSVGPGLSQPGKGRKHAGRLPLGGTRIVRQSRLLPLPSPSHTAEVSETNAGIRRYAPQSANEACHNHDHAVPKPGFGPERCLLPRRTRIAPGRLRRRAAALGARQHPSPRPRPDCTQATN